MKHFSDTDLQHAAASDDDDQPSIRRADLAKLRQDMYEQSLKTHPNRPDLATVAVGLAVEAMVKSRHVR